MAKRILYLIAGLLCALAIKAQPDCFFTHYSSEDGLSQNTVMGILQDTKGNMWFSTWDGINRFDGYTFKTYKARLDNQIALTNNRVDQMYEDKFGFLWLLTYDNHVYRFDPRTEMFEQVPAEGEEGSSAAVTSIHILPGGSVWLFTESEGAIRVATAPDTYRLTTKWYSAKTGPFPAVHVYKVYEDLSGHEWMLTNNGLGVLSPDEGTPVSFFMEAAGKEGSGAGQIFYTCQEHGDEIFFGSENGRVWCYQKKTGEFRLLQLPATSKIVSIKELDEREMLIVTATDGFFVYQYQAKTTEHYDASRFPDAPVYSAYVDRHSEVWFEQHISGSVVHFNPATRVLKTEKIAVEPTSTDRSRPAFHVHEDIYGTVWVHPYGGGFSYFDREHNSLHPFYNSLASGDWRFSNKIHTAFSDRQGNLWMCTHSKGLEKVTFRPSQFKIITPMPHHYESLSNEVRGLCEDHEHNLWVGLKDGKLRVYDKNRVERGYLTEAGTISHTGTPMRGNVYFILEDSKNNLWIATKGDGLVKAEPQGNARYKLTRYQYEKNDIYSLSDDNVYCVYEDAHGRIWVATFAGGVNYMMLDKEGKEVFVNHRNNLKGYPIDNCYKARFITGDAAGHVWIGTTVGALVVKDDFKTPEEAVFHHFVRIPKDIHSLSNNDVHWIISTRQKELYLATFGGGLNKLLSLDEAGNARFKSYSVQDGLPSDVLLSIREDGKDNLWISTENGISKFIPSEEKFENYDDKGISFQVRFSEAASARTSLGNILFGASNGIFMFNPDSIRKSSYVPPVVLSNLLVSNEEVVPDGKSVLKQSLDDTHKLVLSHRENIFTIQYAALDYSAPSEIQYAYILEGFEKAWNYVGKQRTATYTNLPKGNYVFKVRSTNADGIWTENTRALDIEVLPSFWETPFAYFLYFLFVLLIIVTAVYILFTIYRLKHKVSMEQQMTDMKLRFFTDISHELRTPLTLISGPVEYVLENTPLPDDAREQLQVVERNTNRMLRLINQILDFRKIQNKKMKMQVQRIDVVAFTRKIMENFDAVAEEHHIDFLFETEKEELCLWVDVDKYEKIIFNLLSNAFKYTPNDKMITVFVREDEKSVSVGVQDQGIGIAENKKKSIFERFENLVDRNLFNPSTGIGLSLVKELVEMHKAVISVDSKLGTGSCFKVEFLKGREHYDDAVEFLQDDAAAGVEVAERVADAGSAVQLPVADDELLPEGEEAENSKGTMLLVEDNSELRLFLRSIFAAEYRIVEAVDGMQGWSKALKFLPDVIISDVMMPEKDGISMTRELRADMTTSHIPIVLLTAKSSIESKLEGLEYGADDYITKPFSATYLKARVKNLLMQRRKLQDLYRADLLSAGTVAPAASEEAEETKAPEMSTNDRKFMDKLVELMEKNMDNGDLVVDDLVGELAVSRSVFFKKLKTLTGLAPIEFIKEMRINRAVQLIETGEYSMTQISYMVGINDPRYFSKCFKQKMGMTPTEYRDKGVKK
ncbi:two-component regulator propeller domain-containing protein [Bacteroides sp. GD17]|jgi:signal transduction histidine kinase/ligand-binding sensor domain-containing protein/DNA-binding response OmpR family regulator|uniref:hybrid sensor histidine kinase/response regulator transcription factor n=1 Tax=Bacteroides sp. GD17 TaxID=3139826 RepID=UPI0025D9F590|nr:hybrid sensor histidine kinase/response regulator transcription factor [uncultured Bacteroides sp.]